MPNWLFPSPLCNSGRTHRIIWATDFPHQDTECPNSHGAIARVFAGVPEDARHQMLAGNVVDFFGLAHT